VNAKKVYRLYRELGLQLGNKTPKRRVKAKLREDRARAVRPGKPTDNAFIEAFNSKLRSECVNRHWFLSLEDACEKLDRWRRHYNEERPHSAIGNIPPIMPANPTGATSPPGPDQADNSRPERSKVG
jgi:putative transposase